MTVIRWIAMACIGGLVQVQYVNAHRVQERKFQRERMRQAAPTREQKAEPCDAHEAPHDAFTNGNHIGGAR